MLSVVAALGIYIFLNYKYLCCFKSISDVQVQQDDSLFEQSSEALLSEQRSYFLTNMMSMYCCQVYSFKFISAVQFQCFVRKVEQAAQLCHLLASQ